MDWAAVTPRAALLASLIGACLLALLAAPAARADSTPPSIASAPLIVGTPRAGEQLTVTTGQWNGATPMSYSYQWERCDSTGSGCQPIGSASGYNYTPTAQDAGSTLAVHVVATNAYGFAGADTAATQPIAAPFAQVATSTALYGAPTVTTDSSGTLITVNTPSAGLYYRAQLDPTRRYRVTATGQYLGTSFTMRLRQDGGTASYNRAPNGTVQWVVSGAASYELLFFASTSGQYRVNTVTVEDCTGVCKTDADLKQQVLNESPGLSDALAAGDTYRAATLIRNWASPRIVFTPNMDSNLNDVNLTAAQIYYDYFVPQRLGVMCGGAATFLSKLLNLFGISNFRLDFGVSTPVNFTHATVVLPFPNPNQQGGVDYRMLDPTFNTDWTVSSSGRPVSLLSAWELWRDDLTSDIVVNSQSMANRIVLQDPPNNGVFFGIPCSQTWSTGCSFNQFLAGEASTFTADGFETGIDGFIQLMATSNLFNTADWGVPQAFVDAHSTFASTLASADANGQPSTTVAYLPLPPVGTGAPQLTGTPAVGTPLSASTGSWSTPTPGDTIDSYAYQWSSCDATGAGCQPISGQTSSTYTPTDSDYGHVLSVNVTAHNADGTSAAQTATTAPIGSRQLAGSTSPPSVSGSAVDGQVLYSVNGTWVGPGPLSYSYQWERCTTDGSTCTDIAGATSDRYRATSADIGSAIGYRMTATNSYGSSAAQATRSAPVQALAPSNTSSPTITGVAADGQVLSLSARGSWVGSSPLSWTYQWLRCSAATCTAISQATSTNYRLTSADVGSTIELQVTASNVAGSATGTTAPTSTVVAVAPANSTLPSTSGTTVDGQVVYGTPGTWSGTSPLSYGYQWQRCDSNGANCQAISGATADRYRNTGADVGSTLRVSVTATNGAGSQTTTSSPTAPITAAPPLNTSIPTITGTATAGQVMSVSTRGTWSGTSPAFAYQWLRCAPDAGTCQAISGATGSNYRLGSTDVGSTVALAVTATNSAGSATADSAPSAVVVAIAPSSATVPSVTGTAVDQHSMTGSNGTWNGTAPFTYAYRWQRCDSNGANCQAITGATAVTYTVASTDIGATLELTVTASNAAGHASATSAPSPVVQGAPPADSTPPTVTGTWTLGSTLSPGTRGKWFGTTPLSWAYQWERCASDGSQCQPITGATSSNYRLTQADVGATIALQITASNPYGSASATSTPVGPVTAS